MVADYGNAVSHIAHTAALRGRHGNMENRLLGVLVGLRIRGNATRVAAAHADMCPALGYGVVRLGKKDADEVVGGCADMGPMQGAGGVWLRKWRLVCGRWQKVG